MQLFSRLPQWMTGRSHPGFDPARKPTPRFRPQLEGLEGRDVPSTFYAATTKDLIADINAANNKGEVDTIVLTAPTSSTYGLTAANNKTDGGNGLPVIESKGLTIVGNGDTIERYSGAFRLFDVASGGSLTLENVTLQNGYAEGTKTTGWTAEGGAIYNQGTLVLSQATVLGNSAVAFGDGSGGGIWSSGSLTVTNSTIEGNSAMEFGESSGGGIWSNGSLTVTNSTIEGNVAANEYDGPAFGGGIYIAGGTVNITGSAFGDPNGYGGNTVEGQTAYGGAVYIAAGSVTMSADTFGNTMNVTNGFIGNAAIGGYSSSTAGDGYGGAVYVAGGSVTLTSDSIRGNYVEDLGNPDGGAFGDYGGYGGGIYIARAATVYIDSFTVNNTGNNLSNGGDIVGPYQPLP